MRALLTAAVLTLAVTGEAPAQSLERPGASRSGDHGHGRPITAIAGLAGQGVMATGDAGGSVRLWQLTLDESRLGAHLAPSAAPVGALDVSGKVTSLAFGDGQCKSGTMIYAGCALAVARITHADGEIPMSEVRVSDWQRGRPLDFPGGTVASKVVSMAFATGGSHLAVCLSGDGVRIFERGRIESRQVVAESMKFGDECRAVAWTPAGHLVATMASGIYVFRDGFDSAPARVPQAGNLPLGSVLLDGPAGWLAVVADDDVLVIDSAAEKANGGDALVEDHRFTDHLMGGVTAMAPLRLGSALRPGKPLFLTIGTAAKFKGEGEPPAELAVWDAGYRKISSRQSWWLPLASSASAIVPLGSVPSAGDDYVVILDGAERLVLVSLDHPSGRQQPGAMHAVLDAPPPAAEQPEATAAAAPTAATYEMAERGLPSVDPDETPKYELTRVFVEREPSTRRIIGADLCYTTSMPSAKIEARDANGNLLPVERDLTVNRRCPPPDAAEGWTAHSAALGDADQVDYVRTRAVNPANVDNASPGRTVNVQAPQLFVLAVGINKYRDSRWNLDYAQRDAAEIAALVGGRHDLLYRNAQVTTLYDGKATRAAILRELEMLRRQAEPEDWVIVFFAGHARTDRYYNYYFLPHDYDHDYPYATHISEGDLAEHFERIDAKKLLILDTCYAGNLVPPYARDPAGVDRSEHRMARFAEELGQTQPGLTLLAASSLDETARESRTLEHGVFTRALLDALQNPNLAYTWSDALALQDIRSWLANRVYELSRRQQRPLMVGPRDMLAAPFWTVPATRLTASEAGSVAAGRPGG